MRIEDVPLGTIFSGSINSGPLLIWVKAKRDFGEKSFIMPLTGNLSCTYGGGMDIMIEGYIAYLLSVEEQQHEY